MRYNSETNYIQIKIGDTWYDYKYYDPTTPLPLVPVMTSNTTPSGECFGSPFYTSAYSTRYYMVFDGADEPNSAYGTDSGDHFTGYIFDSPVIPKKAEIKVQLWNYPPSRTISFQGSNDGSTWTTLGSVDTPVSTNSTITLNIDASQNTNNYTQLRCNISGGAVHAPSSWAITVIAIQFYGFEV